MRKASCITMTTREFIRRVVSGEITRYSKCSSVLYYPEHKAIYSYGTHYPLLVNIEGKWILNDRGYSHTTAKHISWASECADYSGAFRQRYKEDILRSVNDEITERETELYKLRSGAFRKKEYLMNRIDKLKATLNYLLSI